ncbi:MAG: Eco57I restriction-modification methylase domain-containing protein [Sulfurisoma sp.]|nr:Eco57I restriction-modification methylase domain-containing protein [Sulfurisoma sp.]
MTVDAVRREASGRLDPVRRTELGQYMTPDGIAAFMAGLFDPVRAPVRLLDAGAGIGSLTAAFLSRHANSPLLADAWEVDPTLRRYLADTLAQRTAGRSDVAVNIHEGDFIEDSVWNLTMGTGPRFTHAILNPPYRKIGANSRHRLLLRKAGIETVNLYTAFLALAILLMEPGGEIVAIIPRSFCNGTYYRPFRELLTRHCAIRHIHVFEARDKAFGDDDVLQENIIIKLCRNGEQGDVAVSHCRDPSFADYEAHSFSFDRIVKPGDAERFIHIPTSNGAAGIESELFSHSLSEIGLEVCTGPVVDFRLREYCRADLTPDAAPLLYAHHFPERQLTFPVAHRKKPNALVANDATRKWLMPAGWYVLTKRFSAKEENRRVVAFVVDPARLPAPWIGFENHLNVFHVGKHGVDRETALGLALFLNSTIVDSCFRVFSGHTQVNATDLRQMQYPSRDKLKEFGRFADGKRLTQSEIDAHLRETERYG